jgi:hypothetical protein
MERRKGQLAGAVVRQAALWLGGRGRRRELCGSSDEDELTELIESSVRLDR